MTQMMNSHCWALTHGDRSPSDERRWVHGSLILIPQTSLPSRLQPQEEQFSSQPRLHLEFKKQLSSVQLQLVLKLRTPVMEHG